MLLSCGAISSEKEAIAFILSGSVTADGRLIDKPGQLVNIDSDIKIKNPDKYVSRGALKLEKAISDFNINLHGKSAIDFGASTGGFTDYLLKNGVEKVIAVDIGYGQFAWELRNNKNIFLFERTNIKSLELSMLPFAADLGVADLSFISIRKIFQKLFALTKENAELLLLIKPQFELEKELVENKGVIKNINLHIKSLSDVVEFFKVFRGIAISGIDFSKLRGAKGNIEYWTYLKKINKDSEVENDLSYDKIIEDVVLRSHDYFKKTGY